MNGRAVRKNSELCLEQPSLLVRACYAEAESVPISWSCQDVPELSNVLRRVENLRALLAQQVHGPLCARVVRAISLNQTQENVRIGEVLGVYLP